MKLEELNADQAMNLALEILLEKGFQAKYSAKTWQEAAQDWGYDPEEDAELEYSLYEYDFVWGVIQDEYIKQGEAFSLDGVIFAELVEGATRAALDPEDYYVIVSLSDGDTTRYFKRDGYYSSYGESSLSEAENHEVKAQQVMITDWTSV